jgi:G3E family GTPase
MSLAYDVVPVTLVTGFLGSGKSTLLADALHGDAARDTAVLVNEFGAVGLDHLLMGEIDAQTVLLDNGCVCCSIRGELKDALAALFSRRARGEVPPFTRVVLETTGLATPAPIIATLLADPVIRSHYVLNATVTVVDALHAAGQRTRHPEWLAQVTAADRILISKADLVTASVIDELKAALGSLNPAARIVAREAHAHALGDLLFAPASAQALITRIGASSGLAHGIGSGLGDKGLAHRAASARDGGASITAACIGIDEPIDWQAFTLWFSMLLNRHGDTILRVKGLLAIDGSDQPAVLHAVQHLVHPILHLDAWPDDARESKLVFITDGLAADRIEASYRSVCTALEDAVG